MFSVKSLNKFNTGKGIVFTIESPVEAKRDFKSMMAALGGNIEIDGIKHIPKAFEWHMPATPVYVGEKIGVLV